MIYVVKIWIDKDNLYAESDSGKVAFSLIPQHYNLTLFISS